MIQIMALSIQNPLSPGTQLHLNKRIELDLNMVKSLLMINKAGLSFYLVQDTVSLTRA